MHEGPAGSGSGGAAAAQRLALTVVPATEAPPSNTATVMASASQGLPALFTTIAFKRAAAHRLSAPAHFHKPA